LTETENGVPHGTNTLTGADPGKLNTHLHWPVGGVAVEELETTVDEAALESELIALIIEEATLELGRVSDEVTLAELSCEAEAAVELDDTGTTDEELLEVWLEATAEVDETELATKLELDGTTLDTTWLEELFNDDTADIDEAGTTLLTITTELDGTEDELCDVGELEATVELDGTIVELEVGTLLELAATADEAVTEDEDTAELIWLLDLLESEIIELVTDEFTGVDETLEEFITAELVGTDEVVELFGTTEDEAMAELDDDITEEETAGVFAPDDDWLDVGTTDELATELDTLVILDEVGTTDETLITLDNGDDSDEELKLEELIGLALNTALSGLLHGTLNSIFIKKKLYLTKQVKPSPVAVALWALAVGVLIKLDNVNETSIAAIITNVDSFLVIKFCIKF
jgi:hypothetical protein